MIHLTLDRTDGFSLVETLVAMTILAIGLISLIALQGMAFKLNNKNQILEVAQNILESEIDKVMSLTNLELKYNIVHANNTIGVSDTRAALGSPYDTSPFDQTGIDTIPTGFDYVRWAGYSKILTRDKDNKKGSRYYFLVKTAIDEKFLLQDILARGQITVYWPSTARKLDYIQTTFFIQRK